MKKFEIGDKVQVYESCQREGSGRGLLHAISDDGELLIIGDALDGFFHPKQCRKLVKKKKEKITYDNKKSAVDFSYKGSQKLSTTLTEPCIDFSAIPIEIGPETKVVLKEATKLSEDNYNKIFTDTILNNLQQEIKDLKEAFHKLCTEQLAKHDERLLKLENMYHTLRRQVNPICAKSEPLP